MTQIIEMLESGISGLTVSLKSEDLKEFAHLLIEKAKEQLLPVMVSASHEDLRTKKEVLEKFNVCHTTLWNWERKGYLIPVKIGRKISYRQTDIERIIIERGTRGWALYSEFNDLNEFLTHQSFTIKLNDYENRQSSINS